MDGSPVHKPLCSLLLRPTLTRGSIRGEDQASEPSACFAARLLSNRVVGLRSETESKSLSSSDPPKKARLAFKPLSSSSSENGEVKRPKGRPGAEEGNGHEVE